MDGIIVTSPRFGLDAHVLVFHSDDDDEAIIVNRHSRQNYRTQSDEIRPLLPHSASDESVRSLIHADRFVTQPTAAPFHIETSISPRAAAAEFLNIYRDPVQTARYGTLEHLQLAAAALHAKSGAAQTFTDDARTELLDSAIHLLHEPQKHSAAKLQLSAMLARHIVGTEHVSSDTEALVLLMYNARLMHNVPITDAAADVFATAFITFAKHPALRANFLACFAQHNQMLGDYFSSTAVSFAAKTRLGAAVMHALLSDDQHTLQLDKHIRRLLVEVRLASLPTPNEVAPISRADAFYTITTLHGLHQQQVPSRIGDDARLMKAVLASLEQHFAGTAAEDISDFVPPLLHMFARAGTVSLGLEQNVHTDFFALVAKHGTALQLPALLRQQIVDYAFTQRNLHDAGLYQAVESLAPTTLAGRIYPRPVQACLSELMRLSGPNSGAHMAHALTATLGLLNDPHFAQVFGRDEVVVLLTKNLGQAAHALPTEIKTAIAQRIIYSLTAFAAADGMRRLRILGRIYELTKTGILPLAEFRKEGRWAINNLSLMRDEKLCPADRFLSAELIGNVLWNTDEHNAPVPRQYFINNCRKLIANQTLPRFLRTRLATRLGEWFTPGWQTSPDNQF